MNIQLSRNKNIFNLNYFLSYILNLRKNIQNQGKIKN